MLWQLVIALLTARPSVLPMSPFASAEFVQAFVGVICS